MVAQFAPMQSHVSPVCRLVATDLDGTLLDPAGQLSPRTLRASRSLHQLGVPLILATSRRLTGTLPVAAALDFPLTLLLYDGALVRAWPDGAELHRDALDAQVGQRAVEIFEAHRLRPIVQHCDARGEYLLVGPRAPYSRRQETYLARFQRQVTELPIADLCRDRPDPIRIVVFGERRRLRAAARDIATLPCGWQFLPTGNYGTSELSVFSPSASKATALTHLATRLGVAMEHVLAVGDGINDVSMLRAAGLSVAMANGGRTARTVANLLAPPNSEDGAAWAIERFVLGKTTDSRTPANLVAVS